MRRGCATPPMLAAVGALRCYGDELVVVTVERRCARIVGADGKATELRLTEEQGRAAVVNRAVVGLPEDVGWVAVVDPGVECTPDALKRLRAAATFFFQAEDGIRGGRVTGVQTCALPI